MVYKTNMTDQFILTRYTKPTWQTNLNAWKILPVTFTSLCIVSMTMPNHRRYGTSHSSFHLFLMQGVQEWPERRLSHTMYFYKVLLSDLSWVTCWSLCATSFCLEERRSVRLLHWPWRSATCRWASLRSPSISCHGGGQEEDYQSINQLIKCTCVCLQQQSSQKHAVKSTDHRCQTHSTEDRVSVGFRSSIILDWWI